MGAIKVRVIFALPDQQNYLNVDIPSDSSVRDAILASKVLEYYPQLSLESLKVGIYSNLVALDHKVNDGDRIEIYRELTADPKVLRQRRAEKAITEGRANRKTGSKIEKS